MGWLIVACVLFCIGVLPLGVRVVYDEDGALIWLRIGPVRIQVYPTQKKQEKPAKKKETAPKAKRIGQTTKQASQKQGGSIQDFLPIVETIMELLGGFRRKLRVNLLEMKLIMAADDPCDLAVNYGRAWAALGNLMPHLERLFVIKKRNLQVECDFTAEKTLISARLELTMTVARLLSLGAVYGVRLLRQYLKLRKGGAKS